MKRIRESPRYPWYALTAVMLGTIMAPLDGSIANIALSTISQAYRVPIDAVTWVLLSYLLVTASSVALFGRLGDSIGQKRIYLVGFAIFGLGSLACALAPSLPLLILARTAQGIGAAMLLACTPAIITDTFPAKQLGRAIGMNGAAIAVGLTAGPVLGGFIVSSADWRWIFLINVPISLLALIAAAIILRDQPHRSARLDPLGAITGGSALFVFTLVLSRAHLWGWSSPRSLGLLALALVLFPLFIALERRVREPMIDLTLFANRSFAFSVAASALYFTALFSVVFTLPIVAQHVLGRSAMEAGLLLVPITLLNIVLAPLAGALSDRFPARYLSTCGSSAFALGTIAFALLPNAPPTWLILLVLFVCGIGTAVFSQPNNSTIMGSVPPGRRGVAGGILATSRTTGQALGVALAGAIYFFTEQQTGPRSLVPARAVFHAVTVILIGTSMLSFFRGAGKRADSE